MGTTLTKIQNMELLIRRVILAAATMNIVPAFQDLAAVSSGAADRGSDWD
jgi:hypothetical protein